MKNRKFDYSLLNLCEAAHRACTGASDGQSDEVLEEWRKTLDTRLKEWTKSPAFCERYDNAVKRLVEEALEDILKERHQRTARATVHLRESIWR